MGDCNDLIFGVRLGQRSGEDMLIVLDGKLVCLEGIEVSVS